MSCTMTWRLTFKVSASVPPETGLSLSKSILRSCFRLLSPFIQRTSFHSFLYHLCDKIFTVKNFLYVLLGNRMQLDVYKRQAKLRRAKNTFETTRDYFHYVTGSIADIFYDGNEVPERYLEGSREVVNTCFIIITSERGLCGSFNSNVIKQAEIAIEDDPNLSLIHILQHSFLAAVR